MVEHKIIKEDGEEEVFEPEKLCYSLEQSGAPADLARNVCSAIEQKLTPDVTTTQIFRQALGYLIKEDIELTARYSLRRAVSSLGPAGFLFEQFLEAVMQAHGYETERNVMMQGRCVVHEVDIVARKDNKVCLIEAKYRNEAGGKTHINDVMYADARLIDIASGGSKEGNNDEDYQMWVMTNTKFTAKAIKYGRCRRMKIVGWNYPGKGNLAEMIVTKKLYPITVLPSISRFEREQFAKHEIILVRDILPYGTKQLINDLGIPPQISEKIISEAESLLGLGKNLENLN